MSCAKVGRSVAGRLSTQKKPWSSRKRRAWVFPAPDRPVMITNRAAEFIWASGPEQAHAFHDAPIEDFGGMHAELAQAVIQRRDFGDDGDVAAGSDGDAH